MKYRRLLLVFLLGAGAVGCRLLPALPTFYNEEVVLGVWDTLDAHYGSETFFECEYLRVRDGRIEIIKPYAISRIAVVAYSPRVNRVRLFRAVPSNPGKDDFVNEGTTLRFNSCRENQNLFVAWIPDLSGARLRGQKQKDGFRK